MILKVKAGILKAVLFFSFLGASVFLFSHCASGASLQAPLSTPFAASGMKPQEIIISGSASLGQDLDQMYKEALADALYNAYTKVYPDSEPLRQVNDANQVIDLIALEKEMGIGDYQILRYWTADDRFNLELKLAFDDTKVEQPRLNSLGHFPKLNWVYESAEQIRAVSKTNLGLAANTTRSVEIVAPLNGKRLKLIQTDQKPHDVNGEQYFVQDGNDIKVAELNKHNLSKLIYKWHKKLPDILNAYLGKEALYIIDKAGVIRSFDWENGAERWQLPCSKQAVVKQLDRDFLSVFIPNTELWIVNLRGEKLWVKRFDKKIITAPVSCDNELYCLFENNEIRVFDLQTGDTISTWHIGNMGDIRNIYLGISGKRLFLSYNDKNSHGYLRTYHRFTGDLLWEVSREKTLSDSLIVTPDAVIIGVGNTIEARDPRFGLKLWEEPVYGLVTRLFWMDESILAIAGNRLYRFYY